MRTILRNESDSEPSIDIRSGLTFMSASHTRAGQAIGFIKAQ